MKTVKTTLALVCAALMLFSMCGCRDSSVLERIIYDYLRANQTDMEKNTYDNKEDNQPDDTINDLEKDEQSERENEEEAVDPVYESEQEPTAEDTAGSPQYDDGSQQADPAQADPTASNDGQLSGGASEEDDPDGAGEAPLSPEENANSDLSGEHGTAGGDSTRLVVDDYGGQYQVPQNVNTVAAVDSAAVAVLMLGGVERLAAANADLTGDDLAAAVFPGLSEVPALWSGSGTDEPLSSDGLQRLIEIHPDVCFETSGSATLTDVQVSTLQENGIYYVVLPAPNSVEALKRTTQIVGGVLGDHTADGGYDGAAIARSYSSWVDKTLAGLSSSGLYTLYVDDWDAEAQYSIDQASSCRGYGVAVLQNGRTDSCMAVSQFLAQSGVTNVTSLGAFSRMESVYFTPIDVNYSTVAVTGSAADRLTPVKLLTEGGTLGSADFQIVIAGSAAVKEGLESAELWQNFGSVTSSNGNFTGYGFLDDYGEIVRSTISGAYTVVVNPQGVGDWAGGSLESVLECVWASHVFSQDRTELEVRDTIAEFYQTFYRYSLSDKQLDAILAGEA